MGQFTQWVGLVHELGQLGGTKEFLDGSNHWPNVDQLLRCYRVRILNGHPFTNDPFHPGKPDPELVLQQFTHGTNPPVTQVVDIIGVADSFLQVEEVVQGSKNISWFDVLVLQWNVTITNNRHNPVWVILGVNQNLLQFYWFRYYRFVGWRVGNHLEVITVQVWFQLLQGFLINGITLLCQHFTSIWVS